MALSQQERQFLTNITTSTTELTNVLSTLEKLRKVYVSRTYSSLTNGDIAEFDPDLTASMLSDGINMIDELNNKFLANLAITKGDWQGIMDRLRKLL